MEKWNVLLEWVACVKFIATIYWMTLNYLFGLSAGGLSPSGIATSGHITSEPHSSQSERESVLANLAENACFDYLWAGCVFRRMLIGFF